MNAVEKLNTGKSADENGILNLLDAFSVKPLCSGFLVFFSFSSSLSFIIDSNILENVLVTTIPL
jgi:hypothetical protein